MEKDQKNIGKRQKHQKYRNKRIEKDKKHQQGTKEPKDHLEAKESEIFSSFVNGGNGKSAHRSFQDCLKIIIIKNLKK